ncbi:MAG: hypothetical protein IPN19_05995 [Elusimicrobia bacterium]|nr:hypothetical protein [Elusimicrobiota bacterium]
MGAGRDVFAGGTSAGPRILARRGPVMVFVCPTNMEIVAARLMSFDPHREDLFSPGWRPRRNIPGRPV